MERAGGRDDRLWSSAPEDAVAVFFERRPVGQGLGFVRQTLAK